MNSYDCSKMDYILSIKIFKQITASKLIDLKEDLVEKGIQYARIRTDWHLSDLEKRKEMDQRRSISHDVFIDSCNILSRNMEKNGEEISWRMELGNNRKEIGDFACYLHCILGLKG